MKIRRTTRPLRVEQFETRRLLATVTLEPAKDNSIFEDAVGGLSNGVGQHLFSGRTNRGLNRRALLEFDLSAIPAGASILDANLTLNVNRTVSQGQDTGLHRVTTEWGEGNSDAPGQEGRGTTPQDMDATWIHSFSANSQWNAAGGDFENTPSATLSVGAVGSYTWTGAGLIADVQEWVNDANSNHGWIVIGNEQTNRSAKRFASRESPIAAQRPSLFVEYEEVQADPLQVTSVDVNASFVDPPDLPAGPQPTSWGMQQSEIREISVQFNQAPAPIVAADIVLTNLGLNAPDEADQVIPLQDAQIQVVDQSVVISLDRDDLTEGVYSLELLPTVMSAGGQGLDGNADGTPGDAFLRTGSAGSGLAILRGDFNGDDGVSVFDFNTIAYWFGEPSPNVAPVYVDLNNDDGISIFDFAIFTDRFGDIVVYPPVARPASEPATASIAAVDRVLASEQIIGPRLLGNPHWSSTERSRPEDSLKRAVSDRADLADFWLDVLGE